MSFEKKIWVDEEEMLINAKELNRIEEGVDEALRNAKPLLSGSTDEITPQQVADAIAEGRTVLLAYNHPDYSVIHFTDFSLSEERGAVFADGLVNIDDEWTAYQLEGLIDGNSWRSYTVPLALKTDIPESVTVDKTLVQSGAAADSAVVGERIKDLSEEIANLPDFETVRDTGTVVKVDATAGESIKLLADTTEAVALVHCGKNFLQFPYINNTIAGLQVVTNADGTITVNGTATGIVYIDYASKAAPYYLPAGIYAVSTNISVENVNFVIQSDTAILYPDGVADARTTVAATLASPKRAFEMKEGGWIYGNFVIRTGVVCDNMTLQVQIERGKTPYSNDDSNFTAYEPPVRTQTDVMFPIAVSAMEGLNYLYTQTGDILTAKMTAVAGVSKDTVKKMIEEAARFDADAWGLPVLHLTGDTSAMTKDDAVDLEYKYGDLTGVASVKWQGSSSLNYPKKNYTIKFDQAFEAVEGWGAQKKYCFKANFIDHSHARNVCSCKLWGQIVKSRANVPSELSSLVNGGAIDGFPCIIVLNGEFHGLFTWNIPKDGWMFGAPKAIVCADAHTDATKFKALATLNGDFEVEYAEDEDNTDWILQSLNTAIQAVMNSDGSDLDTVVGQYIDIPSAIDYYIHTVDESADDGTSKNYLLVTFDGVKWYFSAYDRDTVYGLHWDGKSFTSPRSSVVSYAGYANIHAMMNLIYTYKTSALKSRAVSLRNGIKSEANVTQVFSNFICTIPSQVLDEDARKWPTIPSTSASNLAQILNWYRLRRAYLDTLIDAM